jgi:hypothetical protein
MHMVIPSFSGCSAGVGAGGVGVVGAVGVVGVGAQAPINGSAANVNAKSNTPTTIKNLLPFIYTSLNVYPSPPL